MDIKSSIAILFISMTPLTTFGNDQNATLNWYELDFPPYHIKNGPHKGQGFSQKIQQEFISSLPKYQHKKRFANFTRTIIDIKNKPNVCNISFLKTPEHQQNMAFSKPWIRVLSNGLNVRTKHISRYKNYINNGKIDLDALLNDSSFTLGVVKDRPYGDYLDKVIDKYETQKKIKSIGGSSKHSNLLNGLIKTERIDGVLGYEAEMRYFIKQHKMHANATTFLPLLNAPESYEAHMACSKSSIGNDVINTVNKVIDRNKQNYRQQYKTLLSKKSQKYYDSVIAQQEK